jgi:hypothetical protein
MTYIISENYILVNEYLEQSKVCEICVTGEICTNVVMTMY